MTNRSPASPAELPDRPAPANYPSLRGKVALVTGGGAGIGAAIVLRLVEQGCRVAFIDRDVAASEAVVAAVAERTGQTPRFLAADLTDIAALRAAVATVNDTWGPIGILVNNAASDDRHAIESVEPDDFDRRMAVNLRHQFFAIQAVRPQMAAQGGGAIVNLGSHAWMLGAPGMPVYLMAKAGVSGLTKGMARELGPEGIRVNQVVPGWVLTERQRRLWWTPQADERRRTGQCIPDEIEADDIAQMVLFLVSDAARACTGHNFTVDGGRT